MFQGSFVALVTPFKDGELDADGLRANIRYQIEQGTNGLVAAATTGESPTLSDDEKERILTACLDESKGRIPVIMSTGTNSTQKTIDATRKAKEWGAQGALVVTPYYNKPTQEGLFRHYEAVAASADIPLILYNVPGRTGVKIEPETAVRLAEFQNIVSIKEASGDLDQVSHIVAQCGQQLTVLSGDDSLTLPMLSVGAKGVISVVANILPKEVSEMIAAFQRGEADKARKIHLRLYPVIKALFSETNPIPVKRAMELLGMAAGHPRLPLVPLSSSAEKELTRVLTETGLLKA